MIKKKTAFIMTAVVSMVLVAATFLITYFAVRSAPNAKGELYVTASQYQTYMKYIRIDKIQQIIENNFYKNVKQDDLVNGALKGMVSSLNDPYSVYYTKEEFKKYNEKMNGKYTGIGLVIKTDPADGLAYVVQVYEGSPAEAAGIKVNDKLISADGEKLSGLDLETIAEKIVGPEGTSVTLQIVQEGKELTKKIERRSVEMNMVTEKMIDNEIGQIAITQFNGDCVEGFQKAMNDLIKQKAKGVIIDLRNNPGGLLSDVCKILDAILPAGTMVYTQNKEGKQDTYSSDANYWDIPMVVLVNGYSASASEVFAGAVQDYGRAKLIGVKTYGKGIVQTILPIESTGAGIKITTSHYYTPKGRNINGTGIIPDYVLELQLKQGEQLTEKTDTQYQKALEVIKKSIQ